MVADSPDRTPHIAWWQDILEGGELPSLASKGGPWSQPVPVEELYRSYAAFCEANGAVARTRALSMSAWAREMGKLVPGGLEKKRLSPSEGRKAVYYLPPYDECCAAFERAFKVTIERSASPGQVAEPF